ncbi:MULTISPECIES: L,D-transpeptidase family protein [unclassified Streptomyces]|uniref:L,D-transpeptidase family protein n=1 Tax=unclassified Streptomyces TaxID=2593676 RepID=UPI00336A04BC
MSAERVERAVRTGAGPRRRPARGAAALVAAALTLTALAGCGASKGSASGGAEPRAAAGAPGEKRGATPGPGATAQRPAPAALRNDLPGLGPQTLAKVPDKARQVVVVTGEGRDSSRSTVVVYQRRDPDGDPDMAAGADWRAVVTWDAHNARKGWTDRHITGDLRSPIGVFPLTDAGGRLPNPGTRLSYDHSGRFTIGGTGFEGEPLAGSFDYVVAINYNRKAGTSPRDWTRPLGLKRGGGIWFHVDHGGPTQGCVSISKKHMRKLLLMLDPERHPVVVMGDAASLAR